MKAILVNEDKSLRWDNVPDPIIKPDEVLVEIHAAALNRADLMQRTGDYPPPPGCPEWMGLEVSGVITQIGDEAKKRSTWRIGDRVCALLGGGGYAEYVSVRYLYRKGMEKKLQSHYHSIHRGVFQAIW